MTLLKWLINRKKFESKKLSYDNIINFLKAKWNQYLNNREHIKEQVEWRLSRIKERSPECFEKKECYCGCDLKGILYQPSECMEKNKCFPKMKSKKEWKKFKL